MPRSREVGFSIPELLVVPPKPKKATLVPQVIQVFSEEDLEKPIVAVDGWMVEEEPTTKCKHGRGHCEECGTSSRRDSIHTTEGGVGKVGKIPR